MKLLINVADRGTYWEAISVNQNEMNNQYNDIVYEVFSWNVYETIVNSLHDGLEVLIPKNLEGNLDVTDLIIGVLEPLEKEKKLAILKAQDVMITTRLTKIDLLNIYRFITLNNWFLSIGHVITDFNREEKYLSIINEATNSPDQEFGNFMISQLEKFLSLYDEMKILENAQNNLDQFIHEIENIEVDSSITTEEIPLEEDGVGEIPLEEEKSLIKTELSKKEKDNILKNEAISRIKTKYNDFRVTWS